MNVLGKIKKKKQNVKGKRYKIQTLSQVSDLHNLLQLEQYELESAAK